MRVNPRNQSPANSEFQDESDEHVPIFGKWRYWYAFTAGTLILYIIALTVFTWIFA